MNVNATKKKLADGQLVIGSFVYVPSARLTEMVGLLGFDFVVIDMEHGPVDIGMAEDMVRAAECADVTPIIRVSHNTPHLILRALDVGAMGLHVPEIAHVDEGLGWREQRGLEGHRIGKVSVLLSQRHADPAGQADAHDVGQAVLVEVRRVDLPEAVGQAKADSIGEGPVSFVEVDREAGACGLRGNIHAAITIKVASGQAGCRPDDVSQHRGL